MDVVEDLTDFPSVAVKPKRVRVRKPSAAAATTPAEHRPPVADELADDFTASDALRRVEDMADSRKVRGWSQDDLDILSFILFAGVFIGTAKLASNAADPEVRPTSDELDRFCKPLARVIARRIHIPATKSGDVVDGLACLAAVAAYGMRMWDHDDRRRRDYRMPGGRQEPPQAGQTPPAPPNGSEPRRAAMPAWARENLEEN